MSNEITFALSLSPTEGVNSTFDNAPISSGQKDMYIQTIQTLLNNPLDTETVSEIFRARRETNNLANAASLVTTSNIVQDTNTTIQLDMDGNVIARNSDALYASTKEQVQVIMGGSRKISDTEILVADAINQKAFILDLVSQETKWEYNSDRYVFDAYMVPRNDVVISVNQTSANNTDIIINQNDVVIWNNQLSTTISILSGEIEVAEFQLNPDLDLYGDDFESNDLSHDDRFGFRFNTSGVYYWFSYPNLVTGKITVSDLRISGTNQFIILEGDSLDSPFSNRVIKVDGYGNILWTFGGEGLVTNPRSIQALLDGKVLIGC
jgi:hypothetical protein